MKTIKLIYHLVLALSFTLVSCDNDDMINQYDKVNQYDLIGEWASIEEDGGYTLLNLKKNHEVLGEATVHLSESKAVKEMSGSWVFTKASGVLLIQGVLKDSNRSRRSSYQVEKTDDDYMTLFNQEILSEQTFRRIGGHKGIYTGDAIEGISYVSDESVINPETLKAINYGKCFVEDSSTGQLLSVNVLHVTEKMMYYIKLDIDALWEELGEPDVTGVVGSNMACVYNKKNVDRKWLGDRYSAVQFQYDSDTREITRILVMYTDTDYLMSDYSYFLAEYSQDDGYFFKGNLSSYLEADYAISPFIQNGSGYCSYNNISYFLIHYHF